MLKIFTSEFYSIGKYFRENGYASADHWPGALFAVYGAGVLGVSAFRRMQGNRQFFSEVGDDGLSRKRCVRAQSIHAVTTELMSWATDSGLVATWSSS